MECTKNSGRRILYETKKVPAITLFGSIALVGKKTKEQKAGKNQFKKEKKKEKKGGGEEIGKQRSQEG